MRLSMTLTIDNSSHVAVRRLEVCGGEHGVAFTCDAATPPGLRSRGVHDVRALAYNASEGSWWGAAVACGARHAGVVVR